MEKPARMERRALIITALMVGLCVLLMAIPSPSGLSPAGQRVLAVAVLAIGLWCTETLPAGVTGIIVVASLVLSGGAPNLREALVGFADPVAYFLIGVLTLGLAVSRSGLAERLARFFLRRCGALPRPLLATVAGLSFAHFYPPFGDHPYGHSHSRL